VKPTIDPYDEIPFEPDNIRQGLNWSKDWKEGSGDRFRFHTTWKAGLRIALNLLKIPENWVEDLSGNARILYERIYLPYMESDKDERRKQIVGKLMIASLLIYNYDSAFHEIGDWLLGALRMNWSALYVPPYHMDPHCWSDGYKRDLPVITVKERDIVTFNEGYLIVHHILPPRKYLVEVEGVSLSIFVTDTNNPQWADNGWRYPLFRDLGFDAKNVNFGD
jgi:hypothetical protein